MSSNPPASKKIEYYGDLHIHSDESFDGVYKPEYIVEVAQGDSSLIGEEISGTPDKKLKSKRLVSWLSFTDHNSFGGIIGLWTSRGESLNQPYIRCGNSNVVSGVEFTCRLNSVLNKKGRSCKLHLEIYCASLDPSSPLARLVAAKHANDLAYDFGVLEYILSQDDKHNVTMQDVRDFIQRKKAQNPGYSTLSRDDMHEFLLEYHVNVAKSNRAFLTLLKEAPHIERLDVDAEELIDIAHASGGIVVLAHPAQTLRRTGDGEAVLKKLLEAGLDGIEKWYNCDAKEFEEYDKLIIRCLTSLGKEKFDKVIFTGGSDTHNFEHGVRLGMFGDKPIYEHTLRRFIAEVKLEEARRKIGGLSRGGGRADDSEYIESLVAKYEARGAELEAEAKAKVASVSPSQKSINKAIKHMKKKKNKAAREARREAARKEAERLAEEEGMSADEREYLRRSREEWDAYMEALYSENCGELLTGTGWSKHERDAEYGIIYDEEYTPQERDEDYNSYDD